MKRTTGVILGLLIIAVVAGVAGACAGNGQAAIELAVGETLTVTLESNPTTGFAWVLADPDGMLEVTSHEYVMDPTEQDPPPPGTGGVEVWTFKALAKGETAISMEYSQPGDGGEKAVETFHLTVVVS